MSEALYTLALLACPVGMGLMMWFMMRGKKGSNEDSSSSSSSPATDAELTKLRAATSPANTTNHRSDS